MAKKPIVVNETTGGLEKQQLASSDLSDGPWSSVATAVKSNATTGVIQIFGPQPGVTRIITVPDTNCTMARTDGPQTFLGSLTVAPTAGAAYFIANAVSGAAAKLFLNGNGASLSGGFALESSTNNDVYFWNYANTSMYFGVNNSTKMTLAASGLLTTVGKINVDDTTDATSATNGSLQTDGGLSVAKKGFFGDDVSIAAGKVIKINGVQVLGAQQTGMGATLGAATLSGTYATDLTTLQALYNKVVLLETKLKLLGGLAT